MAHFTTNHTTAGANLHVDPFEDAVQDEPFHPLDGMPRDDAMTFTTTTSGIPVPTPSLALGRTEAQSVISNYRRTISPPLPDRLPTPSLSERNTPIFDDLTVPYKDEDTYSTLRPSSVVGNSGTTLVHNAADMGRSDSYQDLGVSCDHGSVNNNLTRNVLEYAEPSEEQSKFADKGSPFQKALGMDMGRYPLEQRIEDKKRGIGRQKYPFVGG